MTDEQHEQMLFPMSSPPKNTLPLGKVVKLLRNLDNSQVSPLAVLRLVDLGKLTCYPIRKGNTYRYFFPVAEICRIAKKLAKGRQQIFNGLNLRIGDVEREVWEADYTKPGSEVFGRPEIANILDEEVIEFPTELDREAVKELKQVEKEVARVFKGPATPR